MPKKIFITGGTGKIGRRFVDALSQMDFELCLLSREPQDDPNLQKASIIKGDISNPDTYKDHLKGVDTVVHLAALTHTNKTGEYYRINTYATADLVKACRLNNVRRFVFVSTRAISQKGGDYSRSKSMAEDCVKDSGLDWVILRFSEVYGSGGKEGVEMAWKFVNCLPVIPVIGNGLYKLAPLYIDDAVFALVKVLEGNALGKIYNITGPEEFTYDQFIDKLLIFIKTQKPKLHIPVWFCRLAFWISAVIFGDKFTVKDQLPRLVSEKSADISMAKKELGFNPRKISGELIK